MIKIWKNEKLKVCYNWDVFEAIIFEDWQKELVMPDGKEIKNNLNAIHKRQIDYLLNNKD